MLAHTDRDSVRVENVGIFDEVVVDHWLHLEQMSRDHWIMNLGGDGKERIMLSIVVKRDGTATVSLVEGELS